MPDKLQSKNKNDLIKTKGLQLSDYNMKKLRIHCVLILMASKKQHTNLVQKIAYLMK